MSDEQEKYVWLNGIKVRAHWSEQLKKAQEITHYDIGGKSYRRIAFGDEPGPTHGDNRLACHDCAAIRGQFHVAGCDVEACPVCGGQSIACDCPNDSEPPTDPEDFSFENHKKSTVNAYLAKRGVYEKLCEVIKEILEQAIFRRGIRVHSVEARSKDPDSLGKKASRPSDANPSKPKYMNPLEEITDLAGIKIIAFTPDAIDQIDKIVVDEFAVIERSDKGAILLAEEKFGYNSIHYLVKLSDIRSSLPEYEQVAGLIAEIQVRTILQHAWAEIEHDIEYKSAVVIPADIRRRFIALAGLIEIADREFQAVQDEDKRLRQSARQKIKDGEIDDVEITPDALKAFLTRRFGADRRISWSSFDYLARALRQCGFQNLRQVETCVEGYDDDHLSRIAYGNRQSQGLRFEITMLAGMGQLYIDRHPLSTERWFKKFGASLLKKYKKTKIDVREYDPLKGD